MRRTFIAGNWKMNLRHASCIDLAAAIATGLDDIDIEVAVCPPAGYLASVAVAVSDSAVGVGGQNLYHESDGAFTGEMNAEMLIDLGCQYVILGHSERRHIIGESNQDVNRKVLAALAAGIIPIVCVGETLAERESGKTGQIVESQFDGSLAGVTDEQMSGIVLAYEPVWAIGTGKVATTQQAGAVHADLRTILESRYNADVAAAVRIQYGGSVKPDNAGELLAMEDIDGALVGGASLKADSFLAIIHNAAQ